MAYCDKKKGKYFFLLLWKEPCVPLSGENCAFTHSVQHECYTNKSRSRQKGEPKELIQSSLGAHIIYVQTLQKQHPGISFY